VDGYVLTNTIGTAFQTEQFNKVPVMEGSNHDEWRLMVAADFDFSGLPVTSADYSFCTMLRSGSICRR
jgi:para-nitrobenzyl esterase